MYYYRFKRLNSEKELYYLTSEQYQQDFLSELGQIRVFTSIEELLTEINKR